MFLVIIVGLLFVGGNILGTHLANDEIATRTKEATKAASATARLGGFPVIYDFLAHGTVHSADLTLHDVPIGPIYAKTVSVALTNVRIDRNALFTQQKVRIRSIATGQASVTVTAPELSAAAKETITIPGNGSVQIQTPLGTEQAYVRLVSGDIFQVAAGRSVVLSVNLSSLPVLPECHMSLALDTGYAVASCLVSPVPLKVIQAIDSGSAGT